MQRKLPKLLLSFTLCTCLNSFAMFNDTDSKQNMSQEFESVKGEFIVKVAENKVNYFQAQKTNLNVRQLKVKKGNYFVVKGDNKFNVLNELSTMKSQGVIEYSEPNYIIRLDNKPNHSVLNELLYKPQDRLYSKLWGLNNTGDNDPGRNAPPGVPGGDINAEKAWTLTKGSRDVVVAVIDTGIDYEHEDLRGNMWVNEAEFNGEEGVDDDNNGFVDDIHGYDFANNDSDPNDGHSHGTHCAGTIGATHDEVGVAGVMADVKMVALKFLSDGGSGTTAAAIEAIDYATQMNVDIMSNSWGGGGRSEALREAIVRANDKGILFVAAAGNSASNNDSRPHYPSNYDVDNVISVAALNATNNLASFSCYGKRTVHVAAPGRNILSSVKSNRYGVYSGTSMATPHVSGVLGLLLANEGQRLGMSEVKERIMMTSVPLRSLKRKIMSKGRVDAYNLLTDTRPPRNEPDPSKWEDFVLEEAFESEHPYPNNTVLERSYTIEGAKYIRVVVKEYNTERTYDYITIRDSKDEEADKITGQGENYESEYVSGDTVTIRFKSDYSVNRWGFLIEKIQFIR